MNADAPTTAAAPAELEVAADEAGRRLDVFLVGRFPQRSRAYFQRCVHELFVKLNGAPSKPSERVKAGDRVQVAWPPEPSFEIRPEAMALDILFEDDDVLVLNKPAGLVVHPGKGNWTGTLVHGLLAHDGEDFGEMIDDDLRPGIVHRLDKDTSGALVIARNPLARERLQRAFRERETHKLYLALVVGAFAESAGRILAPIGRHRTDRRKMDVVKEERGRQSESHWRVLGTARGVSLVEVRILTGRTHQIRVHLAHIRHPVLGDPLYGGRQREVDIHPTRQMLHAWQLCFPHPRTGERRCFTAPLPADFLAVLAELGLPPPPPAATPVT